MCNNPNCQYCVIMMQRLRRSRRLAAKPAVSYYEAPIPSEATIRRRDQRRAEAAIVRNAQRVQRRAEAAVLRETMRKIRQTERILRQVERDAEILAAMPATPPPFPPRMPQLPQLPRRERSGSCDGLVPWAPPRDSRSRSATEFAPQPALSRTEATGCADLPPPPPLRRTCASPDCDEECARCRGNDLLARFNAASPLSEGPPSIPRLPIALGAPPIGATVVRVPVDLATLTRAALQQIIAAANSALASKP